jgi:hypothetical protein
MIHESEGARRGLLFVKVPTLVYVNPMELSELEINKLSVTIVKY